MMRKLITVVSFVILSAFFVATPSFAENQNSIRIHAAIEKAKIKKAAAILACKNSKKKTRKCIDLLKKVN
jgi:hypothetical protein